MAQERANAFDFWGLRTLVGPELRPGDKAPAFTLTKFKNEKISRAGRQGQYSDRQRRSAVCTGALVWRRGDRQGRDGL
jgi:hypothetical protein